MTPWLVVACPGSRADELARCLGSLQHPPERTVVVSQLGHDPHPDARITAVEGGFSLPALWNLGLRFAYGDVPDYLHRPGPPADYVAVLASDTIGHPGSLPTLAAMMATQGWTMAGPDLTGGPTRTLPPERTQYDRVPGGCFMLDARHRLLCDDRYRWWFGDDDLEVRARRLGPVGLCAGTGLELSQPDTGLDTDEKRQWATEDRALFVAEHGCEPW